MKQAIILAAGEGQRLRPFTVSRPKCMLSIADKPVLQYIIETLAQNGIRAITLVVGYRKEQVYDYFGDGEQFGVAIDYITQERQVGTAHALSLARDGVQDEFLVLPGDNLIDAGTIADFVGTAPNALLAKRGQDVSRYGVVMVENGGVKEVQEKPEQPASNLVNTGIYALTRDIFSYIADNILDIPDALNAMINGGGNVAAVETSGTWLDIVYPWDIIGLNSTILSGMKTSLGGTVETGVSLNGEVVIGPGTIVRSGVTIYGPVVIGAGCDIGPQVSIMPSTSIGDNVVIAPFTQVQNSVIGDDVSIGPGCIIEDSVIGRGCTVKGRFTAVGGQGQANLVDGAAPDVKIGVMMGEGCSVENNVAVQPGTIVGNECRVQMSKVLSGRLPDKSLVY